MNDRRERIQSKAVFNGRRFQRLDGPTLASPAQLASAFEEFKRRHVFRLGFINILLPILCVSCAILLAACANHDDSTADQSHHRRHAHGDNSAGGQGSRDSLGLNPSPTGTPIPGS